MKISISEMRKVIREHIPLISAEAEKHIIEISIGRAIRGDKSEV